MKKFLFCPVLTAMFFMTGTIMANNLPDAELHVDEPFFSYVETDGCRVAKTVNIKGSLSHKMSDRVGGVLTNNMGETIDIVNEMSDENGDFSLTFVMDPNLKEDIYYITVTSANCSNSEEKSVHYSKIGKEAKILSFSVGGASAQINGNNVNIQLRSGTDLRELCPVFSLSDGAEAYVDGELQTSGLSLNDFSGGVVKYTVVSEDLTKKTRYDVKVEVQKPSGGGGGGSGSGSGSGSYINNSPGSSQPFVISSSMDNSHVFNDLAGFEWAEEYIEALYKKGIVNGMGNGQFMPGKSVTREEFVKMLVIALGIEGDAEPTFDDIPKNHWAYSYVSAAYANGIIQGVSETSFGAGSAITRQDMALIAYRALEKQGKLKPAVNNNTTFVDIDMVADYARDAVEYMYSAGIIDGVGENRFAPKNEASRSAAAKIIYLIAK